METVIRHRQIVTPTEADAQEAARSLGISKGSFYRLLAIFGHPGGITPLRSAQGLGRTLHPRTAQHVEDAIAELGAGSRPVDILWEAGRRCASEGVPRPSMGGILTRLHRVRPDVDLQTQLRRTFDLLVDAAPLDLAIETDGHVRPAALLAVIKASGIVLAHRIAEWPVQHRSLASLIAPIPTWEGANPRVLLYTNGSNQIGEDEATALLKRGINAPRTSSGLNTGSGIRAVFGRHFGRIKILSRGTSGGALPDVVVQKADAEAVARHLVQRRNDGASEIPGSD